MKVTAIIPAAGSGKRINAKKQFLEILGKPILLITAEVFESCQSIDEIIVVTAASDIQRTKEMLKGLKKLSRVVAGGEERQDSVLNGLKEVVTESKEDLVVIHDAARPLITREIISAAVTEARVSKACVAGVRVKDTLKNVSASGEILETVDRETLWLAQTPQVFRYDVIKEAYDRAERVGYKATDDSKLVERLKISVKMVNGSYENIKITTVEDLSVAEAILAQRNKQ